MHFQDLLCIVQGQDQRTKETKLRTKKFNKETGKFHKQSCFINYDLIQSRWVQAQGCVSLYWYPGPAFQ